jgi:hypothetical protein
MNAQLLRLTWSTHNSVECSTRISIKRGRYRFRRLTSRVAIDDACWQWQASRASEEATRKGAVRRHALCKTCSLLQQPVAEPRAQSNSWRSKSGQQARPTGAIEALALHLVRLFPLAADAVTRSPAVVWEKGGTHEGVGCIRWSWKGAVRARRVATYACEAVCGSIWRGSGMREPSERRLLPVQKAQRLRSESLAVRLVARTRTAEDGSARRGAVTTQERGRENNGSRCGGPCFAKRKGKAGCSCCASTALPMRASERKRR